MGHESWQSGPRCPLALGVANEMSSVRRAQSATRRWRTARASLDELGAGPNSSHACLGSRSRGSCRGRLPHLGTCLLLEKRRAGAWWTRMLFSESECNAALCSVRTHTGSLAVLLQASLCRREWRCYWPRDSGLRSGLAEPSAGAPQCLVRQRVPDMFRRRVGELNAVYKLINGNNNV